MDGRTNAIRTGRMGWMARLAVVAALAAALTAVGAGSAPASASLYMDNLELAIATGNLDVDGRRAVFGVGEAANGLTDLNGDGDTGDVVLHAHDAATGVTTNRGWALRGVIPGPSPVQALWLVGTRAAFLASEAGARVDYNQDGDQADFVPHVLDLQTGAVTNLRRASERVAYAAGYVILAIDEADDGVDENQDGDQADVVIALYDVAARKLIRPRLALTVGDFVHVRVGPGRLVLPVHEASQGNADRNNDGDTQDGVIAYYNVGTKATTNVRVDADVARDQQDARIDIDGRLVALNASEAANGRDINGDGDQLDTVAFAFDWFARQLIRGTAGTSLPTETAWMTFVLDEFEEDLDATMDGDRVDEVLVFKNALTGATWNTGLDVAWQAANHGVNTGSVEWVVAEVSEFGSGQIDINQDGDATDFLLARFDPDSQAIEVIKALSLCEFGPSGGANRRHLPPVSGTLVFACTKESLDGVDVNQDGDLLDVSGAVWDMATGDMVVNLADHGLVHHDGTMARFVDDSVYFTLGEVDNAADYNGNGTLGGTVVARLDLGSGSLDVARRSAHAAWIDAPWAIGSHEVFAGMWEFWEGADLNGDGDASDIVLHVVR